MSRNGVKYGERGH